MIKLEFRMLILRREQNRRTRRKTPVARERTNKQLNSHEVPEPRIEPTTHWDHSGERRANYRNATHVNQFTVPCATFNSSQAFASKPGRSSPCNDRDMFNNYSQVTITAWSTPSSQSLMQTFQDSTGNCTMVYCQNHTAHYLRVIYWPILSQHTFGLSLSSSSSFSSSIVIPKSGSGWRPYRTLVLFAVCCERNIKCLPTIRSIQVQVIKYIWG
jgi:hypothetical protein